MGGGGALRDGCSASNASVLKAPLDLVLSLLNTDDFTFLIWFTLAFAVRAVAAKKLELELSRRSRCENGLSSSAEWRLVLLSSIDMLKVLRESDLRGCRKLFIVVEIDVLGVIPNLVVELAGVDIGYNGFKGRVVQRQAR
jgi:hypothetical protein